MSLCWISLCWMSLCWMSLCWMSLSWVSWRHVYKCEIHQLLTPNHEFTTVDFFTVEAWKEKKKEQDSLNHWINRKGRGKSTKRKRNRNRKRKRNRRQRQYGLFFFKNAAEPESLFRGEMSTRSLLSPPVLPRWATKKLTKKDFSWQIIFLRQPLVWKLNTPREVCTLQNIFLDNF